MMQQKKCIDMTENYYNDSLPLAALTVGQAKEMIGGFIFREIRRNFGADVGLEEKPEPDLMNVSEAVCFLSELGMPTTKKTLYQFTHTKNIPYRKIGRRIIFSRKELLQWIESRTYRPHSQSDEALRLAESARKK